MRVLYTDIDGTLVGPLGNLFWTSDRQPTLAAAEAIVRARAVGLEIVPLSGRSRDSTDALARLIGAETWIGEMGALRSYRRGDDVHVDRGQCPSSPVMPDLHRALGLLTATFAGRLEEHSPWNEGREVSLMVRGDIDVGLATGLLEGDGLGWVAVVDNGVIPRRFDGLPGVERVRCYHVLPRGVSKRAGVAADRRHRGLAREECAVIGDALSDLECADEVARCFVVRNGVEKDPLLAGLVTSVANAALTGRGHGEGFAEAVDALLG